MLIGIDITFLKDQYSKRGIGTYGKEIVKRLVSNLDTDFYLFGFDSFESNLKELGLKKQPNIKYICFGKARRSDILNPLYYKFIYEKKILKANLDLYFAPHFERGLPVAKVKTAVMMHDVIPLVINKYSSRGGIINYIKGLFYKRNLNNAKKADLILTNSDFSKRELINKAGFDEARVNMVYLGIKDIFRSEGITTDTREIRRILLLYKVSKPYILYHGGLEFNKNVPNLIHAYKRVLNRFPDLKLVIVGKEFKIGWDNKVQALTEPATQILQLSEDLKLKHSLIFTGEVDEEHLPLLLNNSEAYVHLSDYEGFGFAVLEAMAAKIPVIAARRSCYPEILENSAYLVDPKNTESVASSILKVLEDPSFRSSLIKKGSLLSLKYSWDDTSNSTLKLIKRTIKCLPKLKIGYLITNFYPKTGGAEANCLSLALKCAEDGHDVTVITSDSNDRSLELNEEYKGIKIIRHRKINKSYYLGFYPSVIKTILASRSDILHVHGFGFIVHDLALIFKKMFNRRTRIINTPHGPFMAHGKYSFFKRILKLIFTFKQRIYLNFLYSIVISVNPFQEKWINNDYGIDKNKIRYIPNSIPDDILEFDKKETVLKELKVEKSFNISFIGRYEKYKGLDDLIKAVHELKKSHRSVKLVAMGNDGEYYEELMALVKDLKADPYITLLKDPDTDTIKSLLDSSKVFVMPSSWEAFGISILEAMAFGNAIISTRTEGGELLVKDDENGYLYDHGDIIDLTSRLDTLISDKILLNKIRDNNRIRSKQYLFSNVFESYKEVLRVLIKQ